MMLALPAPLTGKCIHCKCPAHRGDCPECGCIRSESLVRQRTGAAQRQWIVKGQFFVKNTWHCGEARITASTPSAALGRGYRAAKSAANLRKRARIGQHKLTLIPITGKPRIS